MKRFHFLLAISIAIIFSSCVSKKKYASLDSNYKKSVDSQKICETSLAKLQSANNDLTRQNKDLLGQVDYLKKNQNQVLSALQDMSVLSGKQAESMKQSLKTLSEKDAYIKDLQSAIHHKDSLNLALAMNLKSSLADVNDKDINIKVEKGVVYVDISDKLLFNSGQYTVTEKAKPVLGKIATILNAHPDLDMMVEGHTDSIPIHNAMLTDNWDLSVKRATSVIRILENQYKINPMRMTAAGHSKYIPVASNKTNDGRALNRRTRIIILPQLDQFFKLLVEKK
jgi:chemotaxis protein MotB